MTAAASEERTFVEYLLGRLPPSEQTALEDRYLADEELHAELLATADELAEAYLRHRLSTADRQQFETHFLSSPRRRRRVEFMRTFLAAIEHPVVGPQEKGPMVQPRISWRWWTVAAAAAVAAGMAAVVVLLMRDVHMVAPRVASLPASPSPTPLQHGAPSVTGQGPTPTRTPAARAPRPSPTPAADPIRRVPIEWETTASVEVALSAPTKTVRLELKVPADFPSYDVAVRDAHGGDVWEATGLTPSSPSAALVVDIPAEAFTGEEFILSVEGEVLRGAATPPRSSVRHVLKVVRPNR